MNDVRRVALIACCTLVLLRLAIGWQLLYEGFWKIKTLRTPTPWTSAGYLKNSQGPFRNVFRSMSGDPNDLNWIQAEEIPGQKPDARDKRYWVPAVETQWDRWQKRFVQHYGLTDRQKATLDRWINGSKTFEVELAVLPPSVDFTALRLQNVISYDPAKKRLVVDGKRHLLPEHRNRLEKALDSDLDGLPNTIDIDVTSKLDSDILGSSDQGSDRDQDGIDDVADVDSTRGQDENSNGVDDAHPADAEMVYLQAVRAVFKKSKDGLSFKERLRATVAGNPDWVDDPQLQRLGEIKKYKLMLADYEEKLKQADQAFQWDHLQHRWGKIQAKRAELVGPVKALDQELRDKATELLSVDQIQRGPVAPPWTALRVSDMMTITGLTVLGAMLVFGLATRCAAVMAAVMLFMFYAAMPPLPGLPELPGTEHSFVVNKNLIEVIALLAIASLPTGQWFGVDSLVGKWWARFRKPSPAH